MSDTVRMEMSGSAAHERPGSRTDLIDLVQAYNPADPEHDFDSIKSKITSNYETFATLCSLLKTSLVSVPLLLSLDFTEVLRDALEQNSIEVLSELERWIGFVPENRVGFARHDWFQRFARAGVRCREPRILRKIIRLGHAKIVAELSDWSELQVALFRDTAFSGERSSKVGDSLLLCFLARSNDSQTSIFTESLLIAYLSDYPTAREWIGDMLLNRKVIQPPASCFMLLRSIAPDEEFFERFVMIWADGGFVKESNHSRHAQVSAVVRFCLWRFRGRIPESIVSLLIQGVSEHLESNVEEKRTLGMIVGEEFSICHETGDRLDFGRDKESFIDDYSQVSVEVERHAVPVTPSLKGILTDSPAKGATKEERTDSSEDDVDPTAVVPWPWKPPLSCLFHTGDEEDSETGNNEKDDDECSLEPYDLKDDPFDGLAMIPKHLNQIPPLLASDKYEQVQTALVHLATIVKAHRNRPETRRRASRMLWTLLELDNRFNLADFDVNRTRAMVAFIVCVPKESGPALARAVYSRTINVGTKFVALNAIIEGTRILAEGGFKEDENEPTQTVETERKLIGTVVRISKRLEVPEKRKVAAPNILAPLGFEYFFQPLCRRVAEFENEPILLCKILTTLGFVVERCRHAAGESLRMAEALEELLPWMNQRPEAEIRRASLYALAAIASVNVEMIRNWHDWILRVSEDDPDLVVREMAKRLLRT